MANTLLLKGHEVIPVGRNASAKEYYKSIGLDMVSIDISKEDSFMNLPSKGVDAIVNLAAVIPAANKSLNAHIFLLANTFGAYNSMMFCTRNDIPVHVLTTSHCAVEGYWGIWDESKQLITETMGVKYPYKGDHATYIVSKVAAEEFAHHFADEYGLRSIVYRMTGVQGYGRYESGFEYFVNSAKAGKDIEVYGDPKKVRDHIYVKDVITAIELGLDKKTVNGLYNLSSGIPVTLMEEVKAIVDVFSPEGSKVNIISRPDKPGINKSYVYDISRLKSDSGFNPKFPLNFIHTIDDYKSEIDAGTYSWLTKNNFKGKNHGEY